MFKKNYYFGKIISRTPYGFNKQILSFRKLISSSKEELDKMSNDWVRKAKKFKNKPLGSGKNFIFKLFGNHYCINIGSPILYESRGLSWKDKFGTPRFEYHPQKTLFFFNWEFNISYRPPNEDTYWEMFLWWKNYSDCDIEKAEKTWPWKTSDGKSTWDNSLLKSKAVERNKKLEKLGI
jgi:hypothetical protein